MSRGRMYQDGFGNWHGVDIAANAVYDTVGNRLALCRDDIERRKLACEIIGKALEQARNEGKAAASHELREKHLVEVEVHAKHAIERLLTVLKSGDGFSR